MSCNHFNRRRFLRASAAAAVAPYVRTSHAAGSLSVGFWDHWVPGANEVLAKLCNEWATREKVDLKLDFITSQGGKLLLTITAEAQAKAGHDILAFGTSQTPAQRANLEPVDDLVLPLINQYGKPNNAIEYVGRQDGHWVALPAPSQGIFRSSSRAGSNSLLSSRRRGHSA
jgi:ABC-type glycerol-3-phosphate transport system substrate-binding protein